MRRWVWAVALVGLLGAIILSQKVNLHAASAPAYVADLTGNYIVAPLLSVGDTIPRLTGPFLGESISPSETFALAGKPDGLGLLTSAETFYLFVNHELSSNETTFLDDTSTDKINGARVSLIQFDSSWQPLGGRNLIDTVLADGHTYTLNLTSGDYESTTDGSVLNGGTNLARFCSGYLAVDGFVDGTGAPTPIWFAPEERGSEGRGWAVGVDGVAQALDGLGRYSKEQVLPASQYRASASQTVLISTEDTADSEIYLFVGTQTVADPNGFESGSLYVLRVENDAGSWFENETMVPGAPLVGQWTLVPTAQQFGSGTDLSNWVNSAERSTNFYRLEDIHEDPQQPGTFYVVTTGGNSAENPYGKLHRFTLNASDLTGDMLFETLLVGGETTGVNYDNIVVDAHGKVLLQEDRTATGGDIMAAQERHGQIWAYDIITGSAEAWFETLPGVGDPAFATDYGKWESSGIIESAPNDGLGRSSYLFTVMAHGLTTSRYSEQGQILLAHAIDGTCAPPSPISEAAISVQNGMVELAWTSAESIHLWTSDSDPYTPPTASCEASADCAEINATTASDGLVPMRFYLLIAQNVCEATAPDGPRLGQIQFHVEPGSR